MTNTTRRDLLAALGALAALPPARLLAATSGNGRPFSWERLKAAAATLAQQPWRPRPKPPAGVDAITYDALNAVQYRGAQTKLRRPDGGGGVRFFPINHFQPDPVRIFIVDGETAFPLAYSPDLFQMPAGSPLAKMGANAGFSGFRLMNEKGESDWMAFQGASYFRSAGALDQYGLSARGLAINSGGPMAEEFPAFTDFWIGRAADGAIMVDALLQGPSVVGAYRFANRHGPNGATQDIEAVVHMRADVERLGIAPLTSMFWYDQGDRRMATDWRPEVHDNDGLLILNGSGERLWVPLMNAPHPAFNSFADRGPKGFGLLQRDRNPDHYQDDGVFYQKRPTLWVEPKGDWGAGAVTLIELPTDTETNDNIVAFWKPDTPARKGQSFDLSYRLRWIADEPLPAGPARVVDTFRGAGGRPGQDVVKGATKLVIDFEGASLAGLDRQSGVKPDVSVGHGKAVEPAAYPVVGATNRWRLMVDIMPDGTAPVDVRATLRKGTTPLAEVCLMQIIPQ